MSSPLRWSGPISLLAIALASLAVGCSPAETPRRAATEEAGLLVGRAPGEVPAEEIAVVQLVAEDGSPITFTYITFMAEEGKCRYVIAKEDGATVGAIGSCGHARDSFAATWSVGSIATNGSNFGVAFGSDYQSSGDDRVEVEIPGMSRASSSATIDDGNWLVVLPLPSVGASITALRLLRDGSEVERIDTRPPHLIRP
jgi:hypothetical protein